MKLNQYLLLLLMLLCNRGAAAQVTNHFARFIEKQSECRYTKVPREVLAVYYGWYGNPGREGWAVITNRQTELGNTARYPVKGPLFLARSSYP